MQILVMATHRSGTSTVTGLISRMGAYVAAEENLMPPTIDNPKGYFERKDVCAINDAILAENGCLWDDLGNWDMTYAPGLNRHHGEIKDIVDELNANKPWVLKDPRLCVTLPWWQEFFDKPVAVMVSRDPLEIATSMLNRDGIAMNEGLALWEYYSVAAIRNTKGYPTVHISYNELLRDPAGVIKSLFEDLQKYDNEKKLKPLSEAEIAEFVSKSLYRSKVSSEAAEMMSKEQKELSDVFEGKIVTPADISVSADAQRTIRFAPGIRRRQWLDNQLHEIKMKHDQLLIRVNHLEELLSKRLAG